MKPLVATVMFAVLTACGQSTPTGSASTAPTATPVPTPTATPLPGGLELRPGNPELVDGEAAACIPGCGVGRVAGGSLAAGRYQTEWFFGGYMTIETDGTWTLGEDSNAELSLPTGDNYQVAFLLDPQLVLHGAVAPDVPLEAAAYVDWLTAHPDLVVSEPQATRIGSVPAVAVDIHLAATAGQDESDCGSDPCITFIRNPAIPAEFQHVDGILGNDVYRFYFADIAYAGTDHMLVLKVEGKDRSHLSSIVSRIEGLLASVTIPAHARSATAASALVGEWERETRCEELVAALEEAGLNAWVVDSAAAFSPTGEVADPADPCADAIPLRHSHFFTENGLFGSRDEHGNQVDDGTYRVEGDTIVISKAFPDVTFRFEINGDELTLDPVIPDCRPECFESAWSVSVAYPGNSWTRIAAE